MDEIEAKKKHISELNIEKDNLLKELDELPGIWESEIPSVIENSIDYVTKDQVKNNSDAVKEMGEDNIKSLKKSIQAIKDRLPEQCKVIGELPHLSGGLPKKSSDKEHDRAVFLDFFTPVVRRAMRPFEKLINESELSKNTRHHWFGESGAKTMAGSPQAFAKYIKTWEDYVAMIGKIEAEKKVLERLEAEELWSSS